MVYTNNIKVDVKKSTSDETYLIIQKESRGQNRNKASKNAEKITYNFEIVNNTIVLDAYFLSDFKNLWKDEEVNITLHIPENTTVYFDGSTKNFLYHVDNTKDIYDKEMANHYFMMTDKTLKCTDCIMEEGEEIIEEESI